MKWLDVAQSIQINSSLNAFDSKYVFELFITYLFSTLSIILILWSIDSRRCWCVINTFHLYKSPAFEVYGELTLQITVTLTDCFLLIFLQFVIKKLIAGDWTHNLSQLSLTTLPRKTRGIRSSCLWQLIVDCETGVKSPVMANLWPQDLSWNNHQTLWLRQSGLMVVQIT